jgi:hypothetical protein
VVVSPPVGGLPDLPAGVWRHWKGGDYLVLGLAHDADVDDRTAVVYVPLHDVSGPRLAVRTVEGFLEDVEPGVPRFRYLGPCG